MALALHLSTFAVSLKDDPCVSFVEIEEGTIGHTICARQTDLRLATFCLINLTELKMRRQAARRGDILAYVYGAYQVFNYWNVCSPYRNEDVVKCGMASSAVTSLPRIRIRRSVE